MILFLLSKDKLKHDSTYQVLHGTIFGCMVLTDWTNVLSGKDSGWVRNLTVCAWVSAHVPKTLSSHTWNLNGGWIVKTSQIVVQLSQKGLEGERFPTLLRVFWPTRKGRRNREFCWRVQEDNSGFSNCDCLFIQCCFALVLDSPSIMANGCFHRSLVFDDQTRCSWKCVGVSLEQWLAKSILLMCTITQMESPGN